MFQITDTKGYLIFGIERAQQIGYKHFPRITSPKVTLPLKTHAHLKAITAKVPKQKEMGSTCQDLRHPNVQLPDGAALINWKKCSLPIIKEYILKEYNDVFNAIGTLPGDEYYIKLKKDHEPVQQPSTLVPIKIKPSYKEELQQLCNEGIITPGWKHSEWTNSIVQ